MSTKITQSISDVVLNGEESKVVLLDHSPITTGEYSGKDIRVKVKPTVSTFRSIDFEVGTAITITDSIEAFSVGYDGDSTFTFTKFQSGSETLTGVSIEYTCENVFVQELYDANNEYYIRPITDASAVYDGRVPLSRKIEDLTQSVTSAVETATEAGENAESALTMTQSLASGFAPIETEATSSRNYAIGTYLVYEGYLYKVIKTIAVGDRLVYGTNIEGTNYGAEINAIKSDILLAAHPVGSIYMTDNPTNPSDLFGGTWVEWGQGRVPVGFDSTQTDFNEVEKTGGSKTHTLTTDQIPSHNHKWILPDEGIFSPEGASGTATYVFKARELPGLTKYTENTGGGQAHNNLQPYITCYMWKRTA